MNCRDEREYCDIERNYGTRTEPNIAKKATAKSLCAANKLTKSTVAFHEG